MATQLRGLGASVLLAALLALGGTLFSPGSAQALPQYSYGCDFCHQMPPRDSGTAKKNPFTGGVPGNHETHAGKEANSCVPCHGGEVVSYGNTHRNKAIELVDTMNYSQKGVFLNQTSVPKNPLGICSNVACHSDGKAGYKDTPAWGAKPADTNCWTCHDAAPNTGKHFLKHAAYYGNENSCGKCHSDHAGEPKPFSHATSVGKRGIDVNFAAAPNNGGGSFNGTQCSDIYCHSDGRGNKKPVSWASSTTLDCAGCHGVATSTGSDELSGKHTKHVNNPRLGTNYGCVDCHSDVVSDNNTIGDLAKHVDRHVDMAGRYVGDVSNGTCSTSYCHSDGKGGQRIVSWTQTESVGCNGCHGLSTATGAPDQGTGNSHAKHVTSSASCVDCHSKTTTTGTTIIAGSQHIDGFNNFTAGNNKTFGKLPNKTCSNISCHSGNGVVQNVAPAQWGATLDCSGCHSTLTASHSAHSGLYGCVDCHASVVSSNTVISTPANHMNNTPDVAGATYTSFTLGDGSCATSCHMAGAPKWFVPASGQCGTCHGAYSPLINTDAHAAHFTPLNGPRFSADATGCQVCHVYNGETAFPHANGGNADMKAGYTANGTCAQCHNLATTAWRSGPVSCDSCHNSTVAPLSVISNTTAPDITKSVSSGHGRAGIDKSCADCHDRNSAHINGALGDKRLLSALGSGSDNTECNYCHADAGKVSAQNLNIKTHRVSGPGYLCADCHNVHGSDPNTMMVKQTIAGTAVSFTGNDTFANGARTGVCQVCHTQTQYFTKAGQPQTSHVDSTVNCLECHSHNPASGFAFQANGACDACHGYPPAPRQTLSAVTFGIQGNWSSAKFEDYSGGGGAHTVEGHVPKDLRLTGTPADWTPCLPCHYDTINAHARTVPVRTHVENVSVTMDPQYLFSPDYLMVYSSAKLVSDGTNKTGTCFNVSCHMAPSKPWSIER